MKTSTPFDARHNFKNKTKDKPKQTDEALITQLPVELWDDIVFRSLEDNMSDIANIMLASKQFFAIANSEGLVRKLRHFHDIQYFKPPEKSLKNAVAGEQYLSHVGLKKKQHQYPSRELIALQPVERLIDLIDKPSDGKSSDIYKLRKTVNNRRYSPVHSLLVDYYGGHFHHPLYADLKQAINQINLIKIKSLWDNLLSHIDAFNHFMRHYKKKITVLGLNPKSSRNISLNGLTMIIAIVEGYSHFIKHMQNKSDFHFSFSQEHLLLAINHSSLDVIQALNGFDLYTSPGIQLYYAMLTNRVDVAKFILNQYDQPFDIKYGRLGITFQEWLQGAFVMSGHSTQNGKPAKGRKNPLSGLYFQMTRFGKPFTYVPLLCFKENELMEASAFFAAFYIENEELLHLLANHPKNTVSKETFFVVQLWQDKQHMGPFMVKGEIWDICDYWNDDIKHRLMCHTVKKSQKLLDHINHAVDLVKNQLMKPLIKLVLYYALIVTGRILKLDQVLQAIFPYGPLSMKKNIIKIIERRFCPTTEVATFDELKKKILNPLMEKISNGNINDKDMEILESCFVVPYIQCAQTKEKKNQRAII